MNDCWSISKLVIPNSLSAHLTKGSCQGISSGEGGRWVPGEEGGVFVARYYQLSLINRWMLGNDSKFVLHGVMGDVI